VVTEGCMLALKGKAMMELCGLVEFPVFESWADVVTVWKGRLAVIMLDGWPSIYGSLCKLEKKKELDSVSTTFVGGGLGLFTVSKWCEIAAVAFLLLFGAISDDTTDKGGCAKTADGSVLVGGRTIGAHVMCASEGSDCDCKSLCFWTCGYVTGTPSPLSTEPRFRFMVS
jgi:hypothetical protein